MNLQIKQLQVRMDVSKNSLVYLLDTADGSYDKSFPDTAAESYYNSANPSDSIKGWKCKREKRKSKLTNRGGGVKPLPPALKSPIRRKKETNILGIIFEDDILLVKGQIILIVQMIN